MYFPGGCYHPRARHLGALTVSARKTIQYLQEHVSWQTMASDVEAYYDSCPVCLATRSKTTKPYGMLKTMAVPSRPWESIAICYCRRRIGMDGST